MKEPTIKASESGICNQCAECRSLAEARAECTVRSLQNKNTVRSLQNKGEKKLTNEFQNDNLISTRHTPPGNDGYHLYINT